MKKNNGLPDDLTPSCALCEYRTALCATGDVLCKYHGALKRITDDGVCRHFSFDIFSYKPHPAPSLQKPAAIINPNEE